MTIFGSKVYPGALALAACMLVFGYLACESANYVLGNWQAVSRAFAACGVLLCVCGTVMVASGVVLVASAGRKRWALVAGGAATFITGFVLAGGAWIGVIPCAGPS